MHSDYYILNGKEPVPVSLDTYLRSKNSWAQLARTEKPQYVVSTVFLGINHAFNKDGPPMLFETMIFGGYWDENMLRTSTWDEAMKNHDACVKLAERELTLKYRLLRLCQRVARAFRHEHHH